MKKGQIHFLWFNYAYIVTYLCFQEEPLGFDEKDKFQKKLKEDRGQTKPRESQKK